MLMQASSQQVGYTDIITDRVGIYSIQKFLTRDILYLFVFLIAITPLYFSFTGSILPVCFFYTVVLFWLKKCKIDSAILIILMLWLTINGLAFVRYIGDYMVLPRGFFKQTMSILMPYMILKILGTKFHYVLEDWLFRLSLISLPIYLFETINRAFFYKIAPYFAFCTGIEQKVLGGWYGGLYTFSAWEYRNSGFMWEPGGFAFILIVALFIRFHRNGYQLDFRTLIYIICLITSFSTTGYLVGFLLILGMLAKRAKYIFPVFIIPILIFVFYTNIWGLDFLGPKIQMYIETRNDVNRANELAGGYARSSRLGILLLALEEAAHSPLGYGIFPVKGFIDTYGENVLGANTFAIVLLKWGVMGLFLFMYAIFKSIKKLFYQESNILWSLLYIAFLMMLFSNGLDRNLVVLSFAYYPFIKLPQNSNILKY